jgi:uncharacterized Zn finger protein
MSWHSFRPYVSVAERRRNAMKEIEKRRKKGLAVCPITLTGRTIATTFWGKAWCENLESYSDFANRLPRGRTYVRNDSVVHLEIQPGKISALVAGSELYKVEITISPLSGDHWKNLKHECSGQIGSLVELLQGRLSKHVMEVVTRHDKGLFPKPAEIRMSCSCPDWAGMCKHVAAVMYGVGSRLDEKPDLLFLLRKVEHLELIAGAVDSSPVAKSGKVRGKKTIASTDLSDIFGIEMASPETAGSPSEIAAKKSPTRGRPVGKAVTKQKTSASTGGPKQVSRAPATKKITSKTAKVVKAGHRAKSPASPETSAASKTKLSTAVGLKTERSPSRARRKGKSAQLVAARAAEADEP